MKKLLLALAILVCVTALVFAGCAAPAPAPAQAPAPAPAPAPSPAATAKPAPSTAAPAPAPAAKPGSIELTHITFQKKSEEHQMIDEWITKVQQRAAGRLTVKYLGADEVIPQKEQTEAVRKGLIAMISMPASWAVTLVPEAQAHEGSRNSSPDQRQNGFYDLINECYHKANIHYFMIGESHASTDGIRVFTKKPITGLADFKGLKFSVSNDTAASQVKRFGGSAAFLTTSERYSALERGVVDASISPLAGTFFLNKYYEVLKYYIDPAFSRGTQCVYFNLDKWNAIPDDLKKLMVDTVIEIEKEWNDKWPAYKATLPAKLEQNGMKKITFSAEDGKKLVDSFYEIVWNELVIPKSPQYGPKLKALSGN